MIEYNGKCYFAQKNRRLYSSKPTLLLQRASVLGSSVLFTVV
jgi:hypothetical protein